MRLARVVSVTAVVLGFCAVGPLEAQSVRAAEPGEIVRVEGQATLDRHDVDDYAKPLFVNDNSVLRTHKGRAEVVLSKGVTIRLGEQSSFRMIRNRLGDVRIEMLGGTAFVIATSVPQDPSVTIACEDVVTPSQPGVYRFDAYPAWAAGMRSAA